MSQKGHPCLFISRTLNKGKENKAADWPSILFPLQDQVTENDSDNTIPLDSNNSDTESKKSELMIYRTKSIKA